MCSNYGGDYFCNFSAPLNYPIKGSHNRLFSLVLTAKPTMMLHQVTIVHWQIVTFRHTRTHARTHSLCVIWLAYKPHCWESPSNEAAVLQSDWLALAQSPGRGVRFQFVGTFCSFCVLNWLTFSSPLVEGDGGSEQKALKRNNWVFIDSPKRFFSAGKWAVCLWLRRKETCKFF